MIRFLFFTVFCAVSAACIGQTKTTQTLDDKYDGLSLYFYKNTLRMLNQGEDPEFDEMVKDIEKMKFLMVNKNEDAFSDSDYRKLKSGYQSESYEEMMSARIEGRNFDVFVREEGGRVKGTIILANDSTSLFVMDILGRVALDKASSLFRSLDENSDVGKKIKDFMGVKID